MLFTPTSKIFNCSSRGKRRFTPPPKNFSGKGFISGKGFTLIELIIYLALFVIVVLSLINFALTISEGKTKAAIQEETQANMRAAYFILTQKIKGAQSVEINQSVFGVNPGILYLTMADPEQNPTIFSVSNGILQVQEGSYAPQPITNTQVEVTNLNFTNLTGESRKENIKIDLTLTSTNPNQKARYAETMETAISLR